MSTVVDELITRFTLDEKGYSEGTKELVKKTKEFVDQVHEAGEKVKEFGKGLSERLGLKELFKPVEKLTTVMGLVDFGKDAMEVSKKFEAMELRIGGVVQSAERAKSIMEFGEKESSRTGFFKALDLDQAAIQLESFGLRAERWLPTVEKLGLVFNKTGSGLDGYAEALGKLKQGDTHAAMGMLENSGIGLDALKAKGVQFNGKDIVSSAETVLSAISAIVEEKYGKVGTALEASGLAKTQRFANVWEGAMRRTGSAIETALLPAIQAIGDEIEGLTESGEIDRIAQGFTSLFSVDGGSLKDAIGMIANFLEAAPGHIRGFMNAIKGPIDFLVSHLPLVAAVWAGMWVASKFSAAITAIGGVVRAVQTLTLAFAGADAAEATMVALTGVGMVAVVAAVAAGALVYSQLTGAINDASDATEGLAGDTEKLSKAQEKVQVERELAKNMEDRAALRDRIEKDMNPTFMGMNRPLTVFDVSQTTEDQGKLDDLTDKANVLNSRLKALRDPNDKPGSIGQALLHPSSIGVGAPPDDAAAKVDPSLRYLSEIASNTKQAATDMKRFVLGGGDLGRLGVDSSEVAMIRNGGSRQHRAVAGLSHRAGSALMDAIQEMMADMMRMSGVVEG
jgi:hypothetical protein